MVCDVGGGGGDESAMRSVVFARDMAVSRIASNLSNKAEIYGTKYNSNMTDRQGTGKARWIDDELHRKFPCARMAESGIARQ